MLKIWGRDNSVNVQKSLWCCQELGLAYERIDAGAAFGVVGTPGYRALNPNGLVPTLEEGSFILWESNAIVRYLAAKHGEGNLWPRELKVRAVADMWMDWQNTTFWPIFRPLFWNWVRTPEPQRDPKAMETSRLGTIDILAYLEDHLKSRNYIAGEHFSMGDIPLGCAIWRWFALPIERPEFPSLRRWFDALSERPAYRAVVRVPLS
jgi:glutathione S-transferase